jgi:aspartate-semialdehyde dehydrogenase
MARLGVRPHTSSVSESSPRIAVVGASGLVGRLTLQLLLERGFRDIRLFASFRSVGEKLGTFVIEEATPRAVGAGDFDLCFFSVESGVSKELVPAAAGAGAVCIDKSSAFRMDDGVPLVVPEVNGERALEHTGIVANPNCCTIPLTMALAPIHDAAGLRSVRVATYQSASGGGTMAMETLESETVQQHQLKMDWDFDGVEFDEEVKVREETRKILELPYLPVSATCVRVPVLIGHAESVWIATEEALTPREAEQILREAPGVRVAQVPAPASAVGSDEVHVGRVRPDPGASNGNGISLFLVCDNLRKGAALNAVQIAELVIGASLPAYFGHRA